MKLRQGLAYYAEMDEIFTGKVATGKYALSSASLAKRDRRDDISVSDDGNNSECFSDDPKTDGKNVKKVARRNEKEYPYERILFALSKLTDGIAFPRPEAPLPEISADVKKDIHGLVRRQIIGILGIK